MKLLSLCLVMFSATSVFAQAQEAIGRVASLRGIAMVRHAETPDLDEPLSSGAAIRKSDVLVTGPASSLRILMADKSLLDLGERSRVSMVSYGVKNGRREKASVKVWIGRLWARVSSSLAGERDFEVNTPNAVAGVRGTAFMVDVTPMGESTLIVESGSVEFGLPGMPGQLLGAFEQGRFDLSGNFTGGTVTASDIKQMGRSTRSFGGNSAETKKMQRSLSQQGLSTPGGNSEGDAGNAGSFDDAGASGPDVPPINLDPGAPLSGGSNTTRIQGKIEVQD